MAIATWRMAAAALAVALSSADARAQGDVKNGEEVYKKCRACHLVGEGAKNILGPHLNDTIGRKLAGLEGFNYSENMKELGAKGMVWDEATLHKYLTNPKDLVPNGKMAFPGLKEKSDRDDVIAYLRKFEKK